MQLAPRERRIVIAGGILLVIFLLYFMAWQPFVEHRQQLKETVREQQALVMWMQNTAQEVERLRANSPTGAGQIPEGQSLLALVDQSAKSSRLGTALKRVEPEGQDAVRVWFEQALFDDLVLWLQSLQQNYGVNVNDIVVQRQETAGLTNVRITLAEGDI